MTMENDKLIQYMKSLNEQNNKLTNWKNEPSANTLMQDLRNALGNHKHYMGKINEWLKLLNVESDKKRLQKGRSGISPKVIRRLAEWRYSSLTSTFLNEKNLFKVKATSPNYAKAAIQNELVLNFQFNALINKVKFINDFVRTVASEGTVVCRVGWDEQFQTKEKEIPVYNYRKADENEQQILQQAFMQLQQEMEQTGQDDPAKTKIFLSLSPEQQESIKISSEKGIPVIAEDTGNTQIIKESVQIKNRPAVEVINTQSFVIDPTCKGDFEKAKFCVYGYETNLSELKSAGIYKNLNKLNGINSDEELQETIAGMPEEIFSSMNEEDINNFVSDFKFNDLPRQKLKAYEYWGYYDIDNTGKVQSIVATIVNNVVIRLERNPFPDNKFPFIVVPYLPVKNSVYGEPDAELISDNQETVKALMRSVIDINARGANGQTAIPKGFLDYNNKKRFENGEDYFYNVTEMHPSEAIYMHKANEVPASVMALIQTQLAEAEASTGIKSFQNGLDGNAYGQSVAGMSQAITAITQRESDIIYRLTNGLKEIGNKVVAMNAIWLNEEEVVAITDNEFQNIKRDDLAGDFYLNVDLKSNSEAEGKAQQMVFMMQTLGNTVPWEVTQYFLTEISRMYNLDSLTNLIQQYKPQPNEQEAEIHQLEVEERKAKIAKQLAEEDYYRARSEFIMAQIGQTQADTDQKNLDFLEQQEGVKHARQREIVEAQARAQNEGKIAHENLKGKHALDKAMQDSNSKERIARDKHDTDLAKERLKNRGNKERQNQDKSKKLSPLKGIPDPERVLVPDGLFKADGLGTYIKGDASTSVGNNT